MTCVKTYWPAYIGAPAIKTSRRGRKTPEKIQVDNESKRHFTENYQLVILSSTNHVGTPVMHHISSAQKLMQLHQEILRTFFLQKVTAIERLSGHRCGALLAPGTEYVPQGSDRSLSSPQDMKWTFDLSTGGGVGFVHFQIDVRGGSEILTRSVDRIRIRKRPHVFVHHVRRNRSRSLVQAPKDFLQIKLRIESDHVFGNRKGLNQEEPPHIFVGKLLICSPIHRQGRRDVHKAGSLNALGVIETEPVRHARPAIMSRDQEALVTAMTHHIDLVLRHGAK